MVSRLSFAVASALMACGMSAPRAFGAQTEITPMVVAQQRKRIFSAQAPARYRNKRRGNKPSKHRNLQHTSKRLRRRHRKAKRAA